MKERILLALAAVLLFSLGCTRPAPKQVIVYPEIKKDTSERKAGRAMLFYEAAEKDADVNNVTVIPPKKKQQ